MCVRNSAVSPADLQISMRSRCMLSNSAMKSAVVQIAFGFPYALLSWKMITAEAVTTYIHQVFPDAAVTVIDKTGTQDHLIVRVTSGGFLGKNLLDRHRMVYQALAAPMKDGRIHALEITAKTPEEVNT